MTDSKYKVGDWVEAVVGYRHGEYQNEIGKIVQKGRKFWTIDHCENYLIIRPEDIIRTLTSEEIGFWILSH